MPGLPEACTLRGLILVSLTLILWKTENLISRMLPGSWTAFSQTECKYPWQNLPYSGSLTDALWAICIGSPNKYFHLLYWLHTLLTVPAAEMTQKEGISEDAHASSTNPGSGLRNPPRWSADCPHPASSNLGSPARGSHPSCPSHHHGAYAAVGCSSWEAEDKDVP